MTIEIKEEDSELLERGVAEVIVREEFEKMLKSKKKLRIYLGIDPTATDLTLGHAVPLRKLKQFQDFGHHVILLFGTFTAKIGDPTGRTEIRKPLTDAEIGKNMESYLAQAQKILDIDKIEVAKNGDWLGKMSFEDVLKLASTFTVSQMLHREMYQARIEEGKEINLTEFMYPLMQGYDPIPLKADVQVGGTDQLFNLTAGRKIMEAYGVKPQQIITVPILEGLDGKEKMSKSLGNYIAIMDSAKEMYGKTMSIPDHIILRYFELATNLPLEEIDKIKKALKEGDNPKNAKMRLAREIVALYHSETQAKDAESEFEEIFKNKGTPQDIPKLKVSAKKLPIIQIIIESKLVPSTSEIRRLIDGGGVKIDGEKIKSMKQEIEFDGEKLLQIGKRKFLRIHF
ncbi:tyrosine--tRNA ligase [Candidatus Peregrinibacteria bacterium]|nr:tyrosine--tRNA ligase [Candidatus Peregrinibacteria bacterium]